MELQLQSAINWLLEIIVMGFVSIMVGDFVNGLFQLPYTKAMPVPMSKAIAPVATNPGVIALQLEPVAAAMSEPAITPDPKEQPQFEQLPDPWFSTDISPTPIQQESVVLQFPTLRLLPPAAPVQPKAKATKKSTTKPKSTTTNKSSKPTNKAATQNNSKSRKKTAA